MENNKTGMIRPELPNIVGLSHICIFVDDMEQAVDYYRDLLGVQPDHCLPHWKNQGFFKAGGFVDEAADGDVSIAFVNVPGTKLTLELMHWLSAWWTCLIPSALCTAPVPGVIC